MIDSYALFTLLNQTFAEAREQVEFTGAPKCNFFIFSNHPYGSEKPEVKIWMEASMQTGLKVEGKNLQQCVDEYIRRSQFDTQQKLLRISAPQEKPVEEDFIEDKSAEALTQPMAPLSNPQDDEIPF